MKKKVLITSILMSFAIVACGDAKATNADVPQEQGQQVQEQEVKQEETQKDERKYDEYEYFFSTSELDLDNPDSEYNSESMSPNGDYCGEFKLLNSVTLYASKGGVTYDIGYTKDNIPITCFNSNEDWIRLRFTNEDGTPNDNYLIKVSDFLANYAPADPIAGAVPKRVGDSKNLQKFIDDDNYYTPEEFWTKVKEKITDNTIEADSKDGLFEERLVTTFLSKSENIDGNVESLARELSNYNKYYIEFVCASDEYCDWIIYADQQQEENKSNVTNIYDNIQAWEIRYFDEPFKTDKKIDLESFEDVDIKNRILVGKGAGSAIQIMDENGNQVGILGIGNEITPHIIKQNSYSGLLMIETDEGNFLIDGGTFNSNSYDPSVEHLITIEDFMQYLENACKISEITIKDSKDGLTETYTDYVTRKSRLSEFNLENRIKELKNYMNITEIYVENIVEDGINIKFDVYYK